MAMGDGQSRLSPLPFISSPIFIYFCVNVFLIPKGNIVSFPSSPILCPQGPSTLFPIFLRLFSISICSCYCPPFLSHLGRCPPCPVHFLPPIHSFEDVFLLFFFVQFRRRTQKMHNNKSSLSIHPPPNLSSFLSHFLFLNIFSTFSEFHLPSPCSQNIVAKQICTFPI